MAAPLVEMVGREATMLLTLLALGVGPASWLGRRFDRATRLLVAPALGLCVGISACTTLVWFFPASSTRWALPLLAAGSIALAAPRWRRLPLWPPMEGRQRTLRRRRCAVLAVQIVVVCLAVAGPITYTVADHGSVGPVAYRVADVDGYVMQTDGMLRESISAAAARDNAPDADLVRQWWGYAAHGYAWPLEAAPLAAELDGLLDTGAVETQSSFLIAFMAAAALCVFAAVRWARRRPLWAGPLAGSLLAGALLTVLFFDGAVPAVSGMAVLMAIVVVGIGARADPVPANVAILALAFGGLWATYPPYVAMLAAAAVLLALVLGVRWLRGPRVLDGQGLRRLAARAGLFVGLSVVSNPVGAYRGINLLVHTTPMGLRYGLSLATGPSWLVQTRGLYVLDLSQHSVLSNLVLAGAVPLIVGVVALLGLRAGAVALVAVPIGLASLALAVAPALGIGGAVDNSCIYCATRALAPLSAVLAILFGTGLALLAASTRSLVRRGSMAVALAVAAPVAYGAYQEITTFSAASGAMFLSSSVETAAAHLPATGCTLIEGFSDAPPLPAAEDVLVYAAADERDPGRVSVPTDDDESGGIKYFELPSMSPLPNRYFCSGYRSVLTRVPAIQASRRRLFEVGGIAVERRARPFDVLAEAGITFPETTSVLPVDVSQSVYGPAASPLRFAITGSGVQPVGPAHLDLVIRLASATVTASVSSRLAATVQREGTKLHVCVELPAAARTQTVQLGLSTGGPAQLASMTAAPGACSGAAPG